MPSITIIYVLCLGWSGVFLCMHIIILHTCCFGWLLTIQHHVCALVRPTTVVRLFIAGMMMVVARVAAAVAMKWYKRMASLGVAQVCWLSCLLLFCLTSCPPLQTLTSAPLRMEDASTTAPTPTDLTPAAV